jgi:hypothetical protein
VYFLSRKVGLAKKTSCTNTVSLLAAEEVFYLSSFYFWRLLASQLLATTPAIPTTMASAARASQGHQIGLSPVLGRLVIGKEVAQRSSSRPGALKQAVLSNACPTTNDRCYEAENDTLTGGK